MMSHLPGENTTMEGRVAGGLCPAAMRWSERARVLIPFGAYVTLSNTLILILLYEQVTAPDIVGRILQHVVLLPVLMLCYRQALRIGLPAEHRGRAVVKQLALG